MKLQFDVTTRVSNEQYGTGFLDACTCNSQLNDSMNLCVISL